MGKSVSSQEPVSKINPIFAFVATIVLGVLLSYGFYSFGHLQGEHSVNAQAVKAGVAEWDSKGTFKFKGK